MKLKDLLFYPQIFNKTGFLSKQGKQWAKPNYRVRYNLNPYYDPIGKSLFIRVKIIFLTNGGVWMNVGSFKIDKKYFVSLKQVKPRKASEVYSPAEYERLFGRIDEERRPG